MRRRNIKAILAALGLATAFGLPVTLTAAAAPPTSQGASTSGSLPADRR